MGNDSGQGGEGADTIVGGFGTDAVVGGPATTASPVAGHDLVNGGPSNDSLDGDLPPGDDGQPTQARPNTDRCIGAQGVDVALLCEVALAVEGSLGRSTRGAATEICRARQEVREPEALLGTRPGRGASAPHLQEDS